MRIRACAVALALSMGLAGSAAMADTAPTSANDATAQTAPAAHKKPVDPNLDSSAIVCKREDTTGTRLGGTKVCLTRAEWQARADSSRDSTHHFQNSAIYH